MSRVWCSRCSAMREIEEKSEESAYTGPRTETVYRVDRLSCTHQLVTAISNHPTDF